MTLVLLDVDMPRLDGLGVLEELRAQMRTASLPVIILTAHHDDTEEKALDLGAQDYLRKSTLTTDNLGRAIANAIEKVTFQRALSVQRRQLEHLHASVQQASESMMITDANLDAPGPRITFVNSAFTAMTGYTAEEVLGKTPRLLQGPKTERTVLDRLRHDLTEGRLFYGETTNYRKDGSEFVLEWRVAPLRNAAGSLTHFVATQHDITARKQAEDERERLLGELQRLTAELQ